MNINTLHRALANLGATRHAFYSEADFQFALAWELQKQLPNAKIHLERRDESHNYYVDIWVEEDGKIYLIELKYKTKKATIGSIKLREQSAVDFGCYDYLWDIKRLEDLSKSEPQYAKGYAIILTNVPAYYNSTGRSSAYDDFRINQGAIKSGSLSWGKTNKGTIFNSGNRGNFALTGRYTMYWHKYNNQIDGFQYLINEV